MSDLGMTSKKENIIDILMINIIPILFLVAIGIYHYGWRIYIYFMIEVPVFLFVAIKMLIDYKKYCNPITCTFLVSMIITAIITLIYDRCDIHLSNLFHGPHVWAENSHMMFFIGYYIMENYRDKIIIITQRLSIIIFASIIYAYVDFVRVGIGVGYRSQGFFNNPIPATTIWLMGIWLPIFIDSENKSRKELILKIFYLPPIFFSMERNAWLGFIFIMLVAFIKYRSIVIPKLKNISKKVVVGICLVFGSLVALFHNMLYDILAYRLSNLLELKSVKQRLDYWLYTLEQIRSFSIWESIFGKGWDSSRDMLLESPIYYEGYPMIDNAYLTSLYEYGLLRIILVFIIFFIAFLMLKKEEKSIHSIAIISCLVPSVFYDSNLCLTPMVLVSSFIGFLCSQYVSLKYKKEKNSFIN